MSSSSRWTSEKAFNTMRHSIFLVKFAQLNIPDNVYNWFAGFFTDTPTSTRIMDKCFDAEIQNCQQSSKDQQLGRHHTLSMQATSKLRLLETKGANLLTRRQGRRQDFGVRGAEFIGSALSLKQGMPTRDPPRYPLYPK